MDKKSPPPISPFDELVTPPELQTLKLLIPFTPLSSQRALGILIKYLEFQQTISFFNQPQNRLHSQILSEQRPVTTFEMLTELKPYLPAGQGEMIDTMLNMLHVMKVIQKGQNTDSNPIGMMMDVLTPEQQDMFHMYQSMFVDETHNEKEGANPHE